jgi:hypothetical protein
MKPETLEPGKLYRAEATVSQISHRASASSHLRAAPPAQGLNERWLMADFQFFSFPCRGLTVGA